MNQYRLAPDLSLPPRKLVPEPREGPLGESMRRARFRRGTCFRPGSRFWRGMRFRRGRASGGGRASGRDARPFPASCPSLLMVRTPASVPLRFSVRLTFPPICISSALFSFSKIKWASLSPLRHPFSKPFPTCQETGSHPSRTQLCELGRSASPRSSCPSLRRKPHCDSLRCGRGAAFSGRA